MTTTDTSLRPAPLDPMPPRRPAWVLPAAAVAATAAAAAVVLVVTALLHPSDRSVEVTPVPAPSTAVPAAPSGSAPATARPAAPRASAKDSGSSGGGRSDGAPKVAGPFTEITPRESAGILREAGLPVEGVARYAGTWTDRNGVNLLVATRSIDAGTDELPTAATIRVYHVAHLDTRPAVLRTMTDPSGPPCEFDFGSDVNRDFAVADDLDGDGYLEVSVAWESICTSEAAPMWVKVALLSNGRKYILRGYGWAAGSRPEGDQWPDNEITETEPAASAWPAGFRQEAVNVFTRLYHE